MVKSERMRMMQWLLLAFITYALAHVLKINGDLFPAIQTVLYKLGHVTTGAYFGYLIDSHASRQPITTSSPDAHHIRRAIIMGAAMLAVAFGL